MAADVEGVIWEPGGEWANTHFSDTLIVLVRVRHSADHQLTALLQGCRGQQLSLLKYAGDRSAAQIPLPL